MISSFSTIISYETCYARDVSNILFSSLDYLFSSLLSNGLVFRNVGTKFRKHKLHEFSLSRQDIANAILPVIGERAKQPIIGNTYLDMYATGGTQMLQYLTPILFLKVTRYYVSYELFTRVSRIQHQFSLNYEITTETIIIVFYKFPIIRVTRNEKFKIKI